MTGAEKSPSPSDPDTRTDAQLAGDLVTGAGEMAARMLRAGLTVDEKTSISDVVSDADKAAEQWIVDELARVRPDDGVVGEEGAAAPGRRTWIIDPVDGTYNFVSGLPAWCSALGLVDGDELLLGAVYQQTTGELWVGGPGHPTTLNGVPVPPVQDAELATISIATYLHPARLAEDAVREPILAAIGGAASVRIIGSGSIELAAVSAGRLGVWFHLDTLSWDWLPGAALITAAGGVVDVFHHNGHRYHMAGPPTAVAQVKRAVLAVGS
ncbi:fructose-1,6-bisphosphatase/inositol monophosphatase family enzyme [Nakamurella flavida]|uniref:inositol monophosphatase family protein n=1 Tax=Nakamurella flavida TaxID=363630 RepID=UPI002787C464|nr:inositol monophosphatase [Nakamurella flavida]MDP9779922.1 fructose-1,6-bisphosphatase/inositol monophosphatase family enzyme [Nakamurella flavida]